MIRVRKHRLQLKVVAFYYLPDGTCRSLETRIDRDLIKLGGQEYLLSALGKDFSRMIIEDMEEHVPSTVPKRDAPRVPSSP